MAAQKRFRVTAIHPGVITVEDVFGIRQKDGTLPKVDYFGCDIDKDFVVGDWAEIHICRQPSPINDPQK